MKKQQEYANAKIINKIMEVPSQVKTTLSDFFACLDTDKIW